MLIHHFHRNCKNMLRLENDKVFFNGGIKPCVIGLKQWLQTIGSPVLWAIKQLSKFILRGLLKDVPFIFPTHVLSNIVAPKSWIKTWRILWYRSLSLVQAPRQVLVHGEEHEMNRMRNKLREEFLHGTMLSESAKQKHLILGYFRWMMYYNSAVCILYNVLQLYIYIYIYIYTYIFIYIHIYIYIPRNPSDAKFPVIWVVCLELLFFGLSS